MKNIFKMLLFVVLLSGCYEDKGNYDYTLDSMNDITAVKFSPEIVDKATGKVIEVRQALTEDDANCRIETHLEQTLEKDLDNLDFYWYITKSDDTKDTVYTKGFLEVELPVGGMLEYDVLLQIYDRTTTLSHYSSFKFQTRPPFKNSLFILHGEEDMRKLGNIEIIGKDTMVYTDVKSVTKDENIYQYATGFDYSAYEGHISLTLFSNNGATRVYEPFGMTSKFIAEEFFKPNTIDFKFNKMIRIGDPGTNTYSIAVAEDGSFLTGGSLPVLFKTGYGYNQDPDGESVHVENCEITAATMTHESYFMWDDLGKRFLYTATDNIVHEEDKARNMELTSNLPVLDANVNFSKFPEIKDMTAIYGYLNYQQGWDMEFKDIYFIFKDPSGSYYRCKLVTGAKNSVDICTIDTVTPMNGFTPSGPSLMRYCSCFSTNYVFYANGNTIYRYNVSNYDHEEIYKAPEGYNVTMMKFRTDLFSPGNANQVGDLNRIMSIGLYNDAEAKGAIAEIKFTTAADIDEDFTPSFYDKDGEGNNWGRIKDMQFAHEYSYEIPDYLKEEN
ncbi:MAG: hypothetical protein J6V20_00670 [Bacteroidaceae bacterium]|nr:hypothetical protein [Bacteroidaceae bacterium]